MSFALLLLLTLRVLLGLCLTAFAAYTLLSVIAAQRWRRARQPLDPDFTPPATILKPVRGVDAEAYENFASFCRLEYPLDCYQILFGALDPDDPALELARRLQTEFPDRDIGIVTPGPNALDGLNRKVCNLSALLPHAKHDLLVLCDSDMRVQPDYLRRIVAPFQGQGTRDKGKEKRAESSQKSDAGTREEGIEIRKESGSHKPADSKQAEESSSLFPFPSSLVPASPVGLVTCPYRGYSAQSFAAILEALGIGADFIPSAFVSRMLEGVSFAFGSTIVLPRQVLEEIGGFEALADELADDFRLGNGAKRAGYEVVISDYVVDDVLGRENFRAMWTRRLRWARTVRACRPGGYAGAFITYGTALGLIFLLAMGFSPLGWGVFTAVLGLRFAAAFWITRTCTGDPNIVRWLPLLPVSDVFSFALYVVSYCGNRIAWRGEQFRLLPGGKLARLSPALPEKKSKIPLSSNDNN